MEPKWKVVLLEGPQKLREYFHTRQDHQPRYHCHESQRKGLDDCLVFGTGHCDRAEKLTA